MGDTRAARGPKPAHTRDGIARCGIALAHERGLAAVTMRAVASELGTGAGSLYRYVRSRDELIALMVDEVMRSGGDDSGSACDWRASILTVARSLLDVYLQHRWMADVPPRVVSSASVADYLETCLRALRSAPGTDRDKLEAAALLLGIVTLFARPDGGGAFAATDLDGERWPLLIAAAGAGSSREAPDAGLFERTVIGAVEGILGS